MPGLGEVGDIAGVRSGENVDTRTELAHRIDVTAPGSGELAEAATNAAVASVSESLLTEGIDLDMHHDQRRCY